MKLLILAIITGLVISLFLIIGRIVEDLDKEAEKHKK